MGRVISLQTAMKLEVDLQNWEGLGNPWEPEMNWMRTFSTIGKSPSSTISAAKHLTGRTGG